MIITRQLFLLSSFIVFSTTALHSMDTAPEEHNTAPAPAKTTEDELKEAQQKYYAQKTQTNKAMQELQERINSLPGYIQQATARESVALGFRLLDRGITYGTDELRKKYIGLSEEEELKKELDLLNKEIQQENLKTVLLNNELTISSKETKAAEKDLLESQKLQQDIANACALCDHIPNGYQNPACIKRLNELAARAGIDLK